MADVMGAFNDAVGLGSQGKEVSFQQQAAETAMMQQIAAQQQARADILPFLTSGQTNIQNLGTAMQAGGPLDPNARYNLSTYNASPEAAVTQNSMNDMMQQLMANSSAGGPSGGAFANALQQNAADIGLQGYQSGLNDWEGQRSASFNMMAALGNPNAATQMGNWTMQGGLNMGNVAMEGAQNMMAAQNQQFNQNSQLLGAGANIGKSIYDYMNSGSGGYTPYQTADPYNTSYTAPDAAWGSAGTSLDSGSADWSTLSNSSSYF